MLVSWIEVLEIASQMQLSLKCHVVSWRQLEHCRHSSLVAILEVHCCYRIQSKRIFGWSCGPFQNPSSWCCCLRVGRSTVVMLVCVISPQTQSWWPPCVLAQALVTSSPDPVPHLSINLGESEIDLSWGWKAGIRVDGPASLSEEMTVMLCWGAADGCEEDGTAGGCEENGMAGGHEEDEVMGGHEEDAMAGGWASTVVCFWLRRSCM